MVSGDVIVSGNAFLGTEFELNSVTIVVSNGKITAVEEERDHHGPWICPAFFNAHTHVGDTVAMDLPVTGALEELVTPPNGLKHRILARTPRDRLIGGMRASIRTMYETGTAGFADFREGGTEGVISLLEAAEGIPCAPVLFGRDGGEEHGHGLGISGARDVPGLDEKVRKARDMGKLIAFHAGERDSLDIDQAISYDPDLLVHCTHATRSQLAECAEREIPIVVCPRSNWRLGVTSSSEYPPVSRMYELGCRVLLGTDNVMFVQPDMWQEMAFMSGVYRSDPRDILRSAVGGSSLFGDEFLIKAGNPARFLIIDPNASNMRFSHDPCRTLVNRAGAVNIVKKVFSS